MILPPRPMLGVKPWLGLYPRLSVGLALLNTATSWYDARDLTSTSQQTLTSRVGSGESQLGSTAGSDSNDPVALPGSGYVYLPGTASNNLSVPKDGGWAGTLHVTGTKTDDTTATFTTTASPILIGNTLIAAGSYKSFVVRDTDASGAVRVTINPATETLGQSSWTCTTGQTVTVNRSTSGLTTAVVTRPVLMADGTDDYIQLPAGDTPTFTATTGAYTAIVVYRAWATATSQVVYSSEGATNQGLMLFLSSSGKMTARTGGATTNVTQVSAGSVTDGTVQIAAAVQDNGVVKLYTASEGLSAGTSTTGVGTIPFSSPRLGCRAVAVVVPYRGSVLAYVGYTRALTAAELDAASAFLLGSYS